ncbi:MAG TPA: hypothetical protein VGE67_12165 [Haloferula sp.]
MKTVALFLAAWIAMAGNVAHADDYAEMSFREVFEKRHPGQPYARIRILRAVQNPALGSVPTYRAEVLEDFVREDSGAVVNLQKEIDFIIWESMGAGVLPSKFTPGSEWIAKLKLVPVGDQPVKGLTGYLLAVDCSRGTLLSVKDGVVTGNILKKGYFPGPENRDFPGPPESMKLEEFQKLMATWKKKEAAPAR